MRKIALISIIIVLFISMSFVSADDSLENVSLTTTHDEILSSPDIDNEILQSTNEISVDDSNYDIYFNSGTGMFKDDVDVSGVTTLKIGNVTEKLFTINKPLNVMPISSDCQITNGVIHLVAGSDGSNITNLIINNTKGEIYKDGVFVCKLHGIWFSNSSYNYIFNNTIRIAEAEGCYAMPMGYSSYNRILYNYMKTGFTCVIVMGLCHYNDISYNHLENTYALGFGVVANIIYFNPYGHADYFDLGDCIGNNITNNFIKSYSTSEWSFALALEGQSNHTQVINNTVIGGSYGILAESDNDKRITNDILIKGNTVINSSLSIGTSGNSILVCDNYVTGSSMAAGIGAFGGINVTVRDNFIDYDNLESGILVGSNVHVYNNKIKLSNYGSGIVCRGNNSIISKNIIEVTADNGMGIAGNNNTITNNFISTKDMGIVLNNRLYIYQKIYNNSITNNKIHSESYAVYIEGNVYNTLIRDNLVETNSSEAFYIKIEETFIDRNPGKILDNTVNGVIEDTDTIIIDDNNFYNYFDENGYLTYEFNITQKRMLFFTFLSNKDIHFTDQIILSSNKQANLLYNVSITFSGDACDSSISDFKFYNFDKSSVILDGVGNVNVTNNEFTTFAYDIFDVNVISVVGGCYDSNILNNDIFISSFADYTYGIFISEPTSKMMKRFSRNFKISNNTIFVKSTGVGEGIYIDALNNSTISSNDISLICDDSAYGIALANVFGKPYDIKIDSNEIVLSSKEMSYLIELYMSDSIAISNNYLKGTSNGIYGVGVYGSQASINNNEIVVVSKNLTDHKVFDSLGKGEAAIYVQRTSQILSLLNNTIDVNKCEILSNDSSTINGFNMNNYVIANYNYDYYFDGENVLNNNLFKSSDVILFKNFTKFKTMDINVPILIKPYKHLNQFTSYLILSGNYSDLNITGFVFKNATLAMNNISNLTVMNNSFISSEVLINSCSNNSFSNNSFKDSKVEFNGSNNTAFAFNNLTSFNLININNSHDTTLFSNYFNVTCSSFNLINSNSSINNNISSNIIIINATEDSHAYNSINTTQDNFLNNDIQFNGDFTKSVLYYDELSSNNKVMFNKVISLSICGEDYAIVANSSANIFSNNYLISSNGFRRGNDAVNASGSIVRDNTPCDIYVSSNVRVSGNGSIESPYATIEEALQNALSGSIIYVLPGYYKENNLVIDKNITITAINQEGNTYLDALGGSLFRITKDGALTVNALKIFNGFSVEGGGLFYNKGTLLINNSLIYNSSSYYDNSNPVFIKDKYNANVFYSSYNCENLGLGGAILNYGNLFIESSNLFDNYAHKGGAIADFGKLTIKNSLLYNNTAVHGGAVYTDSKKGSFIDNTYFRDNLAITSLDHCYIKKTTEGSFRMMHHEDIYGYFTQCDMGCGYGGAIFSNSVLTICNSLFEHNTARTGGAIATQSNMEDYDGFHMVDYITYGAGHKYADTILIIDNSTFRGNVAQDTRRGNATMLISSHEYIDYHNRFFDGGAIFGSSKKLYIKDSLFENNLANTDGGALCVQSENSTIEGSKFYNNTAGAYGGALNIFGNSEVFNTEIVSNYARDGGALHYASYLNYNHIQNNMDMFNVTVADNVALDSGGAFILEATNFAIKNSNIYGNKAPNGDTLGSKYVAKDISIIDARNNWWGSADGPDNTIWSATNIRFRTWLNDKVDWTPIKITPSNNENNNGNGGKNNGESHYNPSVVSTGSGVRTGSSLSQDSNGGNVNGFNFPGNWPSLGNGGGNGFNIDGIRFGVNTPSNSKTQIHGNAVNPNSMSRLNSSSINDLSSVGMTANAADSSTSSQSSSSDGGSEESGNAYEIKKEVKKEIDEDLSIFNIFFILLWLFLLVGFYTKYKKIDEN
ncbi:right-handed parallel beta-helix repeat-containing protein [uncultured Methanobrevibacter sp.]|uniref:right-handed parallel beta-helix repeat-containing protein n=1 Tax=uncultured Methanobrevibacter sp. TaxID=253161 RepID=UPI00263180BF|nr:right-handed parallel beta-helix repeat-containing protein [uncultured Methanobrevibacter sp.]